MKALNMKTRDIKAFTLIELSIVLIIIGLLVAGVVGGQSLIRQAELRTMIAEKHKYITAVSTFVLEYDALPGDMENATDYWGSDVTSNGDGDLEIFPAGGTPSDETEHVLFWQHLSLSEILPGEYTGEKRDPSDSNGYIADVNCPASKLEENSCYGPRTIDNDTLSGSIWNVRRGLYFFLGSIDTASGAILNGNDSGIVSARELYGVDKKVDDGLPHRGEIGAVHSACYEGGVFLGSEAYDLTNTTENCNPMFLIQVK